MTERREGGLDSAVTVPDRCRTGKWTAACAGSRDTVWPEHRGAVRLGLVPHSSGLIGPDAQQSSSPWSPSRPAIASSTTISLHAAATAAFHRTRLGQSRERLPQVVVVVELERSGLHPEHAFDGGLVAPQTVEQGLDSPRSSSACWRRRAQRSPWPADRATTDSAATTGSATWHTPWLFPSSMISAKKGTRRSPNCDTNADRRARFSLRDRARRGTQR